MFIDMKPEWILAAAALFFIGACNVGSKYSEFDQRPATSQSFFPVSGKLKDDDSAADQLWWVYRINQGKPVEVSLDDGETLSMDYDDLVMTVDVSKKVLATSVSVNSRSSDGSYNATISLEQKNQLELGETTQIINRQILMTEEAKSEGKKIRISEDLRYEPDSPMRWILDSDDFDDDEPGDVIFQQTYDMHITGNVDTSIDGKTSTHTIDDSLGSITEVWTLLAKEKSLRVQGTDYRNVVEIQQEGEVPDPDTNELTSLKATLWVAKGIGIIKGTNIAAFPSQKSEASFDLIDTNLVQEVE
jgi:hypothetical protein